MKRIALAVAGAAIIGLTACSGGRAPAAAHGNVPVPVSCGQQYQRWEHGQGTGLITTLHTVSVASAAGNPKVLTVALKKARPAVAKATRYPVPACADPRGYWNVLLMHVNAAVANAGSTSAVRAAMKDVPKIESEFSAEIHVTAQANAQ